MAVRQQHLKVLEPYLIGEEPRENGEWDMFCPLHPDVTRSASMNWETSEWYCFANCGGGSIVDLVMRKAEWVDPPSSSTNGRVAKSRQREQTEVVTDSHVAGWAAGLMGDDDAIDWLVEYRGLHTETLRKFEIGWDRDKQVYTIPVRGPEGELWNVRRYNPRPPEGKRKIWQVAGMVSKALYPISSLNADRIIICEGEWDALLTIQNGFTAITRTGAADVWLPNWGVMFAGKEVYVCHDCDEKGETANRKVARMVFPHAAVVKKIALPFQYREKHGEDLTDFWKQYERADFEQLMAKAPAMRNREKSEEIETITVLESFDSKRVGQPVQLLATTRGKKEPGYTVPATVHLSCDQANGLKCLKCTMNTAPGGVMDWDLGANNPVILELIEASKNQLPEILRKAYGAEKCSHLSIEPEGHQAVEILFARPSIDLGESKAGDYRNIKITSAGRHDTLPNSTVSVIGALYPNPRTQANEFLAWSVERQETSIDKFELTPEIIKQLKVFQTTGRPLKKMVEIAKQLSQHVTRIYGRDQMHVMMDLTYHSVISWKFGGEMVSRGWLECLVVGDTQQGKSETARSMARHYQAGEVVNCEAATFAGVVGGLQTFGSGKEWAVTWGAIPLNDRRLVVMEEVSGMSTDQISQMSDLRSSGVAKLVKIQTEETLSRTRLIWLGNPRDARMSDFTYGVQAIRPLIGSNEDIARFDMAMSVSLGEVEASEMNRPAEAGDLKYSSEACTMLCRWAWTRKPEQVIWATGAEQTVYEAALKMAGEYTEDPPLVQGANIRHKIARIAVAMAARLFSTDETYENLIVKPEHVTDAVAFLNSVYGMHGFGYRERSLEILADRVQARENVEVIKQYLIGRKGLAKFLRNQGKFRRQDLEEIMNQSREEANGVINTLWNARMVRKEAFEVVVEPTLHALLREIKL